MVPKPDGILRFCNDDRKLNDVSTFDSYPMPRKDKLIERLGKARFISTLDLTKGYEQVQLSSAAREKTTFSISTGHWQYRVLPFGLHGAPPTFQRLTDILLRPHHWYVASYVDDIVIHSEIWALEGAGRTATGWTHRQPHQMPSRALRGMRSENHFRIRKTKAHGARVGRWKNTRLVASCETRLSVIAADQHWEKRTPHASV
ncbi:hypothetical protein SKAU_G00241320 [Synaphobranchus kaupii]|uniref:ribonuclease H n=1 Tax=Synaphobranchus kaupii TaxID=118154 RepID=A0A9Q1F823_SYNKA|nr:hypothetical protein SKAU_G00241320 [Synaphobranchus kaupii]